MLPQENQTILEQLQTTGIVPAGTQLEAQDVINILKDYRAMDNEVLATYASLDPQATQDRALTIKMNEAIDILQRDPNKHNVLFLIGHAGHWYLGEAFYDVQNNSIKFTLHDVRPDYSQSADQDSTNQQHVIRTFTATATAVAQTSGRAIKITPPHFKDRDNVDGNGYNCGDLVITRGLKRMGVPQQNSHLLTSRTPDELRKQVIHEAVILADRIDIKKDDIEFVPTPHGVAALNTKHPNYDQNKQSLIAPAPAPRQQSVRKQTSSSCTYADLQQIPQFRAGKIAEAIGNDKNKQKAFVAANKAMNEFIDRNIDHDGNIANFEEQFDAMMLKSGPTT